MIAVVKGVNRGYFEIPKEWEGKEYLQRFIQIETELENGMIRVEKVKVPDNKESIKKAKEYPILEEIELMVDFSIYNNYLNIKMV